MARTPARKPNASLAALAAEMRKFENAIHVRDGEYTPRRCPRTGARTCVSRHCEIHHALAPVKLAPFRYAVDRVPALAYGQVPARMGAPLLPTRWGIMPTPTRGWLVFTPRPRRYARLRRATRAYMRAVVRAA